MTPGKNEQIADRCQGTGGVKGRRKGRTSRYNKSVDLHAVKNLDKRTRERKLLI